MRESVKDEYEMLALFEMTPDLVCIAGRNGYFKKINPAVSRTLQYDPEELYSRPISTFIHPDDRDLTRQERRELLEGKALLNFQNRYLTKSGDTVWLEWMSLYIPEKEIVFAIARNITVAKKKEEDHAGEIRAYKDIARHYKNLAEEDRRSLANELHEEVAQLAAALKWQTETVQKQLGEIPGQAINKLEEIISISDRLVKTIRRISFSVSPAMLYDLGFNETMEYACGAFAAQTGIKCEYFCDLETERLSVEAKTDLFRAIQQLLSIIAAHNNISSASLNLEKRQDSIYLKVQSNGISPHAREEFFKIQQIAASINATLLSTEQDVNGTGFSLLVRNMG